jgi:hypothetical protein
MIGIGIPTSHSNKPLPIAFSCVVAATRAIVDISAAEELFYSHLVPQAALAESAKPSAAVVGT